MPKQILLRKHSISFVGSSGPYCHLIAYRTLGLLRAGDFPHTPLAGRFHQPTRFR
jgi:hypothetical protein